MSFTLVDPYDPPISVTSSALVDQTYTLTDDSATPYIHPAFVVDPSYCPLVYSYTATRLDDGASAIGLPTSEDKTFTFSYIKDILPL